MSEKNPNYVIDVQISNTKKHCHESALMTATYIFMCLTQEGKSY
jgi:hypothetical protein